MFKIRKFVERVKKRWNCNHDYSVVKKYRRESYYHDDGYVVHPIGFIIKCQKCGKRKDVGKDWFKRNHIKEEPVVTTRFVKRKA